MKNRSRLTYWLARNLKLNWLTLPLWLSVLDKAMEIMGEGAYDGEFSKTQSVKGWLKDNIGYTPFEVVEIDMSYWDYEITTDPTHKEE